MNKIVVFASGSGTNFQAIVDAVNSGRIKAEISGLITNREKIGAIDKADAAGIPHVVINPAAFSGRSDFGSALLEALASWDPDLIALAGYLIKIPASVISEYSGRIINIHPSLLPKYGGKSYYGSRIHQAVIDAGDLESGCTVHVVTEIYDQGPVIAQKKVDVLPGDTPESLAKRVLEKEHELLPDVIQKFLTQKRKKP